jgi:hypothetical protein
MFLSTWNRRSQREPKARSRLRFKRPACLQIEELEPRVLLNAVDEQYVLRLYDDLFQRPADASGLQFWSSLLDQGASRTQAAAGLAGSTEHQIQEIDQFYASLLKRAPDPQGLNDSLQFLQSGGRSDQLEAVILGSPEYFRDAGAATAPGMTGGSASPGQSGPPSLGVSPSW